MVISAAAFRVPPVANALLPDGKPPSSPPAAANLWPALSAAVAAKPPVRAGKLIVADSKIVHALTDGLTRLEQTVLAFTRVLAGYSSPSTPALEHDATLRQLLLWLGQPPDPVFEQPWYRDDGPLPRFSTGSIGPATNFLARTLHTADIIPVALRTRVIAEHEFNRQVAVTNNKASVLIGATFAHLSYLYQHFAAEHLMVIIDKQGGRDHYLDLLFESFPETRIKVLAESNQCSAYALTGPLGQATFYFASKAESIGFATALASMICKYLREILMNDFNRWFQLRIPALVPTAGYYQDGARWLTDVQDHLTRMGLDATRLRRVR